MAYRKKRSYKKVTKKTYKRRSNNKRRSVPIRKLIRREISRQTENKTKQLYVYARVLSPSSSPDFEAQNIIPLGPDPSSFEVFQGVGQGERIGNQITTKKLILRGTLVPAPFEATANASPAPTQVKMYIFYDKEEPSSIPAPQSSLNFFQNGNSTKGFQNDLTDMWSPVNADRYRVLASKTFKLGAQGYIGDGSDLNSASQNQFYTNNDFKYNCNFSFNLTKHYPKVLKFNDNSSTPTSRGLFCMWHYVRADGSAIGSTQRLVTVQYMQDYEYEDA